MTLRACSTVGFGLMSLSQMACYSTFISMAPSSHFVPPSSTVTPIGETDGSHSKLCGILVVPFANPDSDDLDMAIHEALSKAPGADILLNVRVTNSVLRIPAIFSLCGVSVRGVAAKTDVPATQQQPPPQQQSQPACGSDKDCSADLVCDQGRCLKLQVQHAAPNPTQP